MNPFLHTRLYVTTENDIGSIKAFTVSAVLTYCIAVDDVFFVCFNSSHVYSSKVIILIRNEGLRL